MPANVRRDLILRLKVNVDTGGLAKDRLELLQSVVCCTRRYTDRVFVGKCAVYLTCTIAACVKEGWGVNGVVTAAWK